MTAQDVLNTHAWLAQNAMLDTHQALAHLVAWLDPLQAEQDPDAYIEPYYYEGSEEEFLMHAITVCRACFPDIYAELVQQLRRGCSEAQANDFICKSINLRIGTEIDDIEWMTYGIPVPFMGVDIELDDFWQTFPAAVPVMGCFGIGPNGGEIQRCGEVQTIVTALIDHYESKKEPHFNDLAMLLKWLFSGTGNSLMDYTEEYWNDGGMDWLMWTPNDVEFAAEMIEEAREMMDAAMRGLELLTASDWFETYQINIEAIQEEIERRNKGGKPTTVPIKWPDRPEYPAANAPAA